MDSDAAPRFTIREDEVLQLLAKGMSSREIAAQLGIAAATVRYHSRRIFIKLHARNPTEAVIRAMAMGLLRRDSADE